LPPSKPKPDSEDNKDLSVNITNNNIVVWVII
jgi:hypothetical protein